MIFNADGHFKVKCLFQMRIAHILHITIILMIHCNIWRIRIYIMYYVAPIQSTTNFTKQNILAIKTISPEDNAAWTLHIHAKTFE